MVKLGGYEYEPAIDEQYVEGSDVKRFGVFRISDQKIWEYKRSPNPHPGYFLSDSNIT